MEKLLATQGVSKAIDMVGGKNRYQFQIVAVFTLQNLFRSFFMMYYPYLNLPPTFLCQDPNNPGTFYDCTETNGGCIDRVISPNSPNSLAIDIGLYCEKSYLRALAGTFFFLGGNIGTAYFSYISDRKGRKASLFLSHLLGSISLCLLALASFGPVTYILFLMLTWANMNSFMSISLTFVAEIANEEFANKATTFLLLSITVGEMIIVVVAYFVSSWKVVLLFWVGIPSLLTSATFRCIDETPVYYYTRRNFTKAVQVLKKMAYINRQSLNPSLDQEGLGTSLTPHEPSRPIRLTKPWNYLRIMRHAKLRLRVIVFSVIKLYLAMAYFGAIFALAALGGSIYANSLIAASAEALGYFLTFKVTSPSKRLLNRSLEVVALTGVSFLLIPMLSCSDYFICNPIVIQGILALLLRTFICFVYGFIYSLANSLFPPEVRSQCIGISYIFGAVGGMVSPFVILAAEKYQLNPLFLFGVLGSVALFAARFVPEEQLNDLNKDQESSDDVERVQLAQRETSE